MATTNDDDDDAGGVTGGGIVVGGGGGMSRDGCGGAGVSPHLAYHQGLGLTNGRRGAEECAAAERKVRNEEMVAMKERWEAEERTAAE